MLTALRASTIFMFLFPIVFQPALPRPIIIILFLIDFVLLAKTAEEEERKERNKDGTGFVRHGRNTAMPFDHRAYAGTKSKRHDTNASFSVNWHSAE